MKSRMLQIAHRFGRDEGGFATTEYFVTGGLLFAMAVASDLLLGTPIFSTVSEFRSYLLDLIRG